MYNNENVMMAVVNKSTQAIADIIAHPGAGKRLAIDRIFLNLSGGANVATLTGGTNAVPISLGSLGVLDLHNDEHNPTGIFPLGVDQAFRLTLANATTVVGWVLYRIINN